MGERALAMALGMFLYATSIGAQYPRLELVPAEPTTSDSVRFYLAVGEKTDDCVPTYVDSLRMELVSPVTYPPKTRIYLSYLGIPPDRGTVCRDTTVEYGPSFELGQLSFGTYMVYLPTDTGAVDTFYVPYPGTGATICGKVLNGAAGWIRPFVGARVHLCVLDTNDTAGNCLAEDSTTMDTYYEFRNVPLGGSRLTYSADGYLDRHVDLDLRADTVVSMVLYPDTASCGLNVTIQYASDTTPVVGCTVSVAIDGVPEQGLPAIVQTVVTDTNGQFIITGISPNYSGCRAVMTVPPEVGVLSVSAVGLRTGMVTRRPKLVNQNVATVTKDSVTHALSSSAHYYTTERDLEIRYSLTNLSSEPKVFELPRLCHNYFGPVLFELACVTPDGDTVRPSVGYLRCEEVPFAFTILSGESYAMQYPGFMVDTAVAPMTICARLLGHGPDTSLCIEVDITGTSTVSAGLSRAARKPWSVRTGAGSLHLCLQEESLVSVASFLPSGRLVSRPVSHRRMLRGTHAFELLAPKSGATLQVVRVTVGRARWVGLVHMGSVGK